MSSLSVALFSLVASSFRTRAAQHAEILALRHQLTVLQKNEPPRLRIHRKTRCKALHEFKLNRQEKFLYVCDTLHMSEWDVRVLDIQDGAEGEHVPFCLDGRGATPSESCGGPTGYRLMLKRQREGAAMSDHVLREVGLQILAEAHPDQPPGT